MKAEAENILPQELLEKTWEGGNGQSWNTPLNFPLNGTKNRSTSTFFVTQSEMNSVGESPKIQSYTSMVVLMELTSYKVIWNFKWQIAKFWCYGTM